MDEEASLFVEHLFYIINALEMHSNNYYSIFTPP